MTSATEIADVANRDRAISQLEEKLTGRKLGAVTYWTILAKCTRCGGAVILGRDTEAGPAVEVYGIWPKEDLFAPNQDVEFQELLRVVPLGVKRELVEARKCFDAGAYTATAVMVRRVLEGTLSAFGIEKKPLAAALATAQSQGIIDSRLAEWATALRVLGNDGAHFAGTAIDKDDSSEAIKLCEAIVRFLYLVPAQVEALRTRRSKPDVPDR
jgi:hypothetical protein